MPFGKKKPTKAKTEEELLLEAIGQVAVEQGKRDKQRKRRWKRFLPAWLDYRFVVGIVAILVIILGDAVRRENQEFCATLTAFSGQVTVQEMETAGGRSPVANERLEDGWVINTGPGANATLEFPDKSAMTLDQNTALRIKLMEYSRAGRWRMRSFALRAGRLWARVSPNFGDGSEQRIHTPSAVAAVRGTTYSVAFDPAQAVTTVQCAEGYVTAEGFSGAATWVGQGGETAVAYGRPVDVPRWMQATDQSAFSQDILTKPIPPELWLKTAELTLTQVLDAPLSILGIGKSSWARGAADLARRTAAMEALRYVMQFMEGSAKFPDFVNPETLQELGLPYADARRILKSLNGDALMKYEQIESGRSYRIIAQARDRRRTTYLLTPTGLSQVDTPEQ